MASFKHCDIPHFLIDWVKIRQDNNGNYDPISDGHVINVDSDGTVLRSTAKSLRVPGSYDSSCSLRITESYVELSFNPSRWDKPDNLFGVDINQAIAIADSILAKFNQPPLGKDFVFTRLDLTANFETGSYSNVQNYLAALRVWSIPRTKKRAYPGTVSFSNKAWSITVYDKAKEIRAHRSPYSDLNEYRETVADYCESVGLVRIELRLGRDHLKALNLRDSAYVTDHLLKLAYQEYIMSIPDDAPQLDISSLTVQELGTFCMWQQGYDLVELYSESTERRHRQAIKRKLGVDISGPPPLEEKKNAKVILLDAKRPHFYKPPIMDRIE